MLNMLKRIICKHTFKQAEKRVLGVTSTWALEPTRLFEETLWCPKCGKTRKATYCIHRDNVINKRFYDTDGWPIDESGNKLSISTDY